MKTLKHTTILIILLASIPAMAQDYKHAIGINSKATMWRFIDDWNYSLGGTGITYSFQTKKNHVHEIELSDLNFYKAKFHSIEGSQVVYKNEASFSLGARYEYILPVYQWSNGLQFRVGAGLQLNYLRRNSLAGGDAIPGVLNQLNGTFFINPSISYPINDRLSLNLSVPLNFYSFSLHHWNPRDGQGSKGLGNIYGSNPSNSGVQMRFGLKYSF